MQLLLSVIDWEYPDSRTIPESELWDLGGKNRLSALVLTLANGVIVEMRVEAGSEDELAGIRNMIVGTGGGKLTTLLTEQKEKLWLYQEGDDCYLQGADGYIFVNPTPQPDKFPGQVE